MQPEFEPGRVALLLAVGASVVLALLLRLAGVGKERAWEIAIDVCAGALVLLSGAAILFFGL